MKNRPSFPHVEAAGLDILQVNLGRVCNQSCLHCHFEAGPDRAEYMDWETQRQILSILEREPIATLDLTGGSPELNPTFHRFVASAATILSHIKVRTNLSVLIEPEQADLPEFLARHGVELVASLPCYTQENVDAVRGDGVYERSISALHRLNDLGYGVAGGGLNLILVYNPGGPALPAPQAQLEADYRRELAQRHGIEFTHLLTLTNMPIGRFEKRLRKSEELDDYLDLLIESHNPEALPHVMCRALLSVGWRGCLYDCDFNQALGLGLCDHLPQTIWDFNYEPLAVRLIRTAVHCYGCTAGAGSSCMGSLVAD